MFGGWTDWDLTDVGIEQAKRIGERLSQEIKDQKYIMYSSDLKRARQTAENVAHFLDIEPIYTVALREINEGEATGKNKEWAKENKLIDEINTIDDIMFKGAESMRDIYNRLSKFHDEIKENAEENIILVAHGISLGVFHMIWLGMDVEMFNKSRLQSWSGGVSFMNEGSNKRRVISRLGDLSYIRV